MASLPSLLHSHLLFSPSPQPRRSPSHFPFLSPGRQRLQPSSPCLPLRGGSVAARLGMRFSDFEAAEDWARLMLERAEGALYTLADAAVTASSSPDVAGSVVLEEGKKQGGDWLSGITDYMETVLKVLKDGLSTLHVPYAYGFAIILLTVLVKAATFPLSKKQVESAMAMRSLAPQVKAIQERYAGDKEKIQLETARLYKLAGVNPLAGCLPTLVTIPVWIGLYRALSNVANEGLLTEGFFWIPSLAGPTTIAARQSGSGISWLFPFVDGHPPLGWSDTLAYLVLPVLLIISQYVSVQIMQPTQGNDPSQKNAQAITQFLPLMIGYFALSVPSGLSLYWFTNNILSTAQQIWLQKLGGAKNPVKEYSERIRDSSSNIKMITTETPSKQEKLSQEVSSSEIPSLDGKPTQEISSSTTPRRGERFKQLKEQEERRKREREEEKRKAEEAAKLNLPSNDEVDSKVRDVKSTVQVESPVTAFTDDRSQYHPSQNESFEVPSAKINGNYLKMNAEEVKTQMPPPETINGGFRHNVDSVEKSEQGSPEVLQEEKAIRTSGSIDTQTREVHLDQPRQFIEDEDV